MKPQSSNTKKPSDTSASRSNVSASEYLGKAIPRTESRRGLLKNEPKTYEAARQWLNARVAGTSTISFRQFYDEFLKPVLNTQYGHKGILEYLKANHAEEYRQIR